MAPPQLIAIKHFVRHVFPKKSSIGAPFSFCVKADPRPVGIVVFVDVLVVLQPSLQPTIWCHKNLPTMCVYHNHARRHACRIWTKNHFETKTVLCLVSRFEKLIYMLQSSRLTNVVWPSWPLPRDDNHTAQQAARLLCWYTIWTNDWLGLLGSKLGCST